MNDKKFAEEYRNSVDSVKLPIDFKDKILSELRSAENTSSEAKVQKHGSKKLKLAVSVLAAVLVLAVGLSAILTALPAVYGSKEVRFYVASATNLCSVAGARLVFKDRDGQLLTDETGQTVTVVTDENGEAVASLPAKGEYSVQITTEGYITLEENAQRGNYYISPEMSEDTYRAVLTWNEDCDLDAHLSVTTQRGTEKLNYFNSDIEDENGQVIAALDTDSENGDGPETITFNAYDGMSFCFSVASYSALKNDGSLKLSDTGAQVTLYRGETCMGTYSVDAVSEGNVWCVFKVENSQLEVCDYTYSVSAITEIK